MFRLDREEGIMRPLMILLILSFARGPTLFAQSTAADFRSVMNDAHAVHEEAIELWNAGGPDADVAMKVLAVNAFLFGALVASTVSEEYREMVDCPQDQAEVAAYADSRLEVLRNFLGPLDSTVGQLRSMSPRSRAARTLIDEMEAVADELRSTLQSSGY